MLMARVPEMKNMTSILIVEDDVSIQGIHRRIIGTRFTVLFAPTVDEGKKLFLEHRQDLAAVILDGIVPLVEGDIRPANSPPTTLELARFMRTVFTGPIIATSSGSNNMLLTAGCSHACNKMELLTEIPRILKDL